MATPKRSKKTVQSLSSYHFQSAYHDPATIASMERMAGFGHWLLNTATQQIRMSGMAAQWLDVPGDEDLTIDEACLHVVPDDLPQLLEVIHNPAQASDRTFEFRAISHKQGMRWLKCSFLSDLTTTGPWLQGILQDVTAHKHAAIREKLSYELTQHLVSPQALGDTIDKAIELICRNLGWEWGAYWAMDESTPEGPQLVCMHHWNQKNYDVGAFNEVSHKLTMAPNEGLIGRVWATGNPEWVDDMANDPRFLRRHSARACGLMSGYVFPVSYLCADGNAHRPGVLEFYSSLTRQPEAQLPKLSATIGALIAQTAQRIENEAIIQRLANVDELTDLANRSHFYRQLNRQCDQSAKQGNTFALVFIDLDRFKPINDAFGHEAGNHVLQGFAARLRELAPTGSCVGRLGGDEFAMLLPQGSDDETVHCVVDAVLAAARQPFRFKDIEMGISASIGVSCFPENGSSGPELLRSADAAMYRVKHNGRNGSDFFSHTNPTLLAQQSAAVAHRLSTEAELQNALKNQELFLEYQPIFDVRTGGFHAVEALVRWRKPDGTLVPPNLFIPIAEQSHLIVELGQWVMAQACQDLVQMQATGLPELKLHVNMAATEFTNTELPATLRQQVDSLGLSASHVVLELTESMLMKSPEQVVAVMKQLRLYGFEISLDDFGMGHSSLSMLKNLPITSMKIDRSFVQDLAHKYQDRAIAQTILNLGRDLHIDVIAEGIENQEQLTVLASSGCHLLQGFLLAKPLPLPGLLQLATDICVSFEQTHPPLPLKNTPPLQLVQALQGWLMQFKH